MAKDWESLTWSDFGIPESLWAANNNEAARIANQGRINQSEPTAGPGSTREDAMWGTGNPERGS